MSGVPFQEYIRMSNDEVRKNIQRFHTKQLLKMRQYISEYEIDTETGIKRQELDAIVIAELKNREHVPNKKESRVARIRRKKQGSSRGRRDK